MRTAILQARVWGWSGRVPAEQLADLMDAVHDLPTVIQHWDDLEHTIKNSLESYDQKWAKSVDGEHGLFGLYERILKLNSDGQNS